MTTNDLVHRLLDAAGEREPGALAELRPLAHVTDRLLLVLVDPQIPIELVGEIVDLARLRLGILQPMQLGGLRPDFVDYALLFTGKALDAVHDLGTFARQRLEQAREQQISLVLPFDGATEKLRYQLLGC